MAKARVLVLAALLVFIAAAAVRSGETEHPGESSPDYVGKTCIG